MCCRCRYKLCHCDTLVFAFPEIPDGGASVKLLYGVSEPPSNTADSYIDIGIHTILMIFKNTTPRLHIVFTVIEKQNDKEN